MNETMKHRGALSQGMRVKDFEFLEVLGHGGFGITYKGWNTVLQKTVAIKEYMPMDTAIRDADWSVHPITEKYEKDFKWGLDRFLEEARMLARFEHPSIVQVQQFFEAHGTAYIVMEYLDGQTLSGVYGERDVLNEQQLCALLEPILNALEQIHDANFLHRDIKPSNVMFRQENIPVLIDFGAARAALAIRSQTVTAIVTPGFSPIEQYSTNAESKQGPWTDIYAVGALLYRGMTGVVPIDATSRIMDDQMVPIAEAVKEHYSESFVRAVDWAMQLRASDRPLSIGEWREALDGGKRKSKAVADLKPAEIVDTAAERHLSGRMKWLVSIGLVTVLAVGGIAYWWDELAEQGIVLFGFSSTVDFESGIARVRDLIAKGRFTDARSAIGELAESGLDDSSRAELESALETAEAAALAARFNACERLEEDRRFDEALSCCREVLEIDANHQDASGCVVRVPYLKVGAANTVEEKVEGYHRYALDHPGLVFAKFALRILKDLEEQYWESIRESGAVSKYRLYLEIYPDGRFTDDARRLSAGG